MLIMGIHFFCLKKYLTIAFLSYYSWRPNFQEVSIMMTGEQKQQIIVLRRDGAGYGRIAARLQISINTVKSFCRRHGLVAKSADSVCEQCGKPIEQNPGRKRKRFCCDACRNKWWNAHLELVKRKAVYTYTCPTCGKEFTVYGNSHRKFCSHACYIAYRFGGVRHG